MSLDFLIVQISENNLLDNIKDIL